MKKVLLTLGALIALAASAAAEVVQIGDFFYNVDMTEGSTLPATIVQNPDGTLYSGNVTIPNSVELPDGTMRIVNKAITLNNSAIEELTVDMVPFENFKTMSIMMRNNPDLSRAQFNQMINPETEGFYPTANLNLGQNHGCIHCFLREEEDENLVVVDKFNVFGPDGEKLKVAMMVEGSRQMFYPDENDTFHLDKNWRHDGEYCMVLPVSMYTIIILVGVAENGDIIFVRTESTPTHTGLYAYDGAFTYEVSSQGAFLVGATEGADVPADVVIPESVEFEGKAITVKATGVSAFQELDIKSVTLPATIDSIYTYCFDNCPELESVDLSATKVKAPAYLFYHCPKLTDVSFPETLQQMYSTFVNCESLDHVDVPDNCKSFSNTFRNCPSIKEIILPAGSKYNDISNNSGLLEATWEWEGEETLRMTITNMGVKFSDGMVPEYYPYTSFSFVYNDPEDNSNYVYGYFFNDGARTDADNVFTFDVADFYAPDFAPAYLKDKFQAAVNVGTHEEFDKENNNYPLQSIIGTLNAPEPGTTAIDAPVVDTTDAPVQWFNLQGMSVAGSNLTPGIYIRRQGNTAKKVLIK